MKSNTLSWNDLISTQKVVDCLRENKVILAPSDTVWGLCGAVTQEVFDTLNELKVRNDKPYLLLARDVAAIERYAFLPLELAIRRLLESQWPGPLTVIFKARSTAPSFVTSAAGTIAFRVPHHLGLQSLLGQVSVLFSTSANLSGEPVPMLYNEISPAIKEQVAGVIFPEKGQERQSGVPSTILDLSSKVPTVIREGAVSRAVLAEFLKEI